MKLVLALAVLGGLGRATLADDPPEDAGTLPSWMCSVGSLDAGDAPEIDDADLTRSELAPTGVLRVGVNYGNPNNSSVPATVALPDGTTAKKLSGVAVDLACRLAARLGVPLVFTGNVAGTPGYNGIPAQSAAFQAGDFDVGFSQDPLLRSLGLSAHSHLWVEGHFLVPAVSAFVDGTLAELDQLGVRIAVAFNNSTDIFLRANLRNATVVDTSPDTGRPLGVQDALALLTLGKVDAFAGSLSAELPLASTGAYRALPAAFQLVHLGMFVHDDLLEAQHDVSVFVEWAKRKGYIADAIAAAGLVGVQVPPPEKAGGVGDPGGGD